MSSEIFLSRNIRPRSGFTLIEMSIVLLIISLIVGGIIGGQELVKAARLQRVGKEANEIRDAVRVFEDKYGALPGDLANAGQLWANSGCTDSDPLQPCSGDQDGRIWRTNASVVAGEGRQAGEKARFWQHLVLAQMFPGNYDGLMRTPNTFVSGVNAPATPIDGLYFSVGWRATFVTSDCCGNWVRGQYSAVQNLISLDGNGTFGGMTATDAKSIDDKVDDGVAYTGRVIGANGDSDKSCPAWNNITPFDYVTSMPGKDCGLRFNTIDTKRGV